MATALPRQELALPDAPADGEDRTPLIFELAIDGTPHIVELWPSSLRSPSFQLMVQGADGKLRAQTPAAPATYRGSVLGLADSQVRASLWNGQLRGTLQLGAAGQFALQPVTDFDPQASPSAHVVIPKELDELFGIGSCGVEHDAIVPELHGQPIFGTAEGTGLVMAEIAFDADFQYYQDNGSTITGTVNDIEAVMNGVSAIYENDLGLTFEITVIIVRTAEPDPYSTTSASGLLNQFAAEWEGPQDGWQRDLAHLMTGKNLNGSTIGIANVGCVCGGCYGLSSRFTISIGQRIALVAHEIGHQFGAFHCDGASGGCKIMCSSLGGCGTIEGFAPASINALSNAIANDNCLIDLGPPLVPPLSESFTSTTIDTDFWIVNDGCFVSTAAVNEPSPPWSLNLDATSGSDGDQNQIWTNDLLLGSGSWELRFFSQHRGVPSGGVLAVDYRSQNSGWIEFYSVVSDGSTQNEFVEQVVILPSDAVYDGSRLRFRTEVSAPSHDWYIDDISLDGCVSPEFYCTGKLNSDGCVPIITVDGLPSLSDPNPNLVSAFLVNAQKPGMMIYSYDAAALPFQDGTLCAAPPLRRTGIQQSGGSLNFPCDGSFAFDVNAHIQSGIDPFLTLAQEMYCQFWYRDPFVPSQTGLSNAVALSICP